MNTTLIVLFAYLAVVLMIGPLSLMASRRGDREDFFLATRTIGPIFLLFSLFGTHMSAFALIGSTGEGFKRGIGVYGLMASSSALVAPLVFLFIGVRVWRLGKRHRYVTQCQFFRDRWESDAVGLVLFALLVAMVIPYLLIGLLGGAAIFETVAGFDRRIGSLIVASVVLGYVFMGGIRGATWANGFQTIVFLSIGLVSFAAMVGTMGDPNAPLLENLRTLAQDVSERKPSHLAREGVVNPWTFLSYTLIPLSVGMFPHVNMHWLTARSAAAFKPAILCYPIFLLILWAPMVLLGTFAAARFESLDNPNAVLAILIDQTGDPLLKGLFAAGVLAAVMSSLDSQSLALGEMFTNDIVVHYGGANRFSEATQVALARGFVTGILVLAWLVSLTNPGQVFTIGAWCFAGFSALLPVTIAGLFWRGSTKAGVLAAATSVFVISGWLMSEAYVPGKGFRSGFEPFGLPVHPVAILLVGSTISLVVVSLLTTKPSEETLRKFFPDSDPD